MFWNRFFLCSILLFSTVSFLRGATFTVSNLNDAGAGSLRDAINQANGTAGAHTINFSVTGTISLTSGNFANINRQITIDGGTLGDVVLNCNNSADFGFFLVDATCINSEIRNMVINNYRVHGIAIISANPTGIRITNCRIGTNAAGTAAAVVASSINGIVVDGSSGNTISNCLLSGCRAFGIQINNGDNNVLTGNIIGLNAMGNAAIPNAFSGIQLNNADNTIIGCATAAERNLISANLNHGIQIVNTSLNTRVFGNYIGTNGAGTAGFGNAQQGIHILNGSTGTIIGSATAGTGNLISGNGLSGIYVDEGCNNASIKGNTVGLNVTGTAVIPNVQNGVSLAAASNCVVGGYTAAERNVVGGNGTGDMGFGPNQFSGISASSYSATFPCINNQIIGNYVGLGADGTTQLENGNHGIWLYNVNSILVENNRVSINTGNTGTIITEQNRSTIYIANTNTGTVVKGNTILRGRRSGICMENVSNVVIGGTNAGDRNLIQSAQRHGIEMINASNCSVHGNSIGTDAAGTVNLGNGMSGVHISGVSTNNEIGGFASGKSNKIAYNAGYGVAVVETDSRFDPIRNNEIYCNVNKGIFLNAAGNENLAAPVINPTSNTGNVFGTAGANALVDLYYTDPTCNPCSGGTQQGKTFIATITADGAGAWSYTSGVTGLNVTATQTNIANSTSEFSSCSTLPVELVYFEARGTQHHTVWLNWSTAGEINSDLFVLERSVDGVHFEEIGTVEAAGNSSQLLSYSFEDYTPESGINYYRIKILDLDGSLEYSEIKAVNLKGAFISVHPNPTKGLLQVHVAETRTNLELLTVTGQTIQMFVPSTLEITLDLRSLSRGVYVLRAYSETGSYQAKVVLE